MPSKEFHELIDRCKEIHDRKSHDYAEDNSPFSNFEQTAIITSWFTSPIDQVFSSLIGIKLSRIGQLQNGKKPNNESIEDSFVDLVNYCALWGAFYKRENLKTIASSIKEVFDKREILSKLKDKMDLAKGTWEGFNRPEDIVGTGIKIKEPGTLLPEICSDCNKGTSNDKINHSLVMHSAVYNSSQRILQYPNPQYGTILLTNDFFKP